MNYRHAYHAGNHGDVLKHAILARVLSYMTSKDKPMAVLDAHAGIGRYDLSGAEAFKTGEWEGGIGKLLSAPLPTDVAHLLEPYLKIVRAMNTTGGVQHYPGSPEIAASMLRSTDRLILNELHPEDRITLAARYGSDKRIRLTEVDALQAVKANLPFVERRGLLLIDPAYEVTDETDRVLRMVQQVLQRMPKTVLLVWYPVTTTAFADALCKTISGFDAATLDTRLLVREPHATAGLAGSGVVVMNPPFTLYDELQALLPQFAALLGQGKWGKGSVRWLTPPK